MERVREILAAHEEPLAEVVRNSWATWQGITHIFPQPLSRTRAQVISNLFHNGAKTLFSSAGDARVLEESERLLVVLREEFVLRFKFLTRDMRTSNYPTIASRKMDAQKQIDIPGIENLPRVVVGYTLGGPVKELDGIWVLFAISNSPQWVYPIDGSGAASLLLPFPTTPPPQPHEFRIVGEEDADDEGTTQSG